MKKRKPKPKPQYQLTWYTQLSDGYVDVKQVILLSKHSANIMYGKIVKQESTLSIELEEI